MTSIFLEDFVCLKKFKEIPSCCWYTNVVLHDGACLFYKALIPRMDSTSARYAKYKEVWRYCI